MALTVSQTPQTYTPAYNAQTFTALSDQIAITDFKYIVIVQVNSGTIFTYDILQRPDGYLVYDPIEIVKNYIDRSYFNPNSYTCVLANGKAATVQVKIKEYYTGAIQSTYTYNYTAWDACLNSEDFSSYTYSNYINNGLLVDPRYTYDFEIPDSRVFQPNAVWIHFFRNGATNVNFTVYDPSSTIVATLSLSVSAASDLIYYVNVGYNTLVSNGISSTFLQVGYSVEWEVVDGITNLFSGYYTITDNCTKYLTYPIYYLKRNGNIGYMNFDMISQKTINKKTNTVRLNPSKITSGSYGSNVYDAEKYTVSTLETKQMLLNTDWITEEQSIQLQELWDSPICLLFDDNNIYRSVTIIENSYTTKKIVTDKLFNYSVNIEYNTQETRQRGI